MATFFSAIKGKFDAEYEGRYLGNIIEAIAETRPEVIKPILDVALKRKENLQELKKLSNLIVSTETEFVDEKQKRRADLEVTNQEGFLRVFVEIKVKDNFLPEQLEDYIKWASSDPEHRIVVVLTANPLNSESTKVIKNNDEFIRHMYISEFSDKLQQKNSELIEWLRKYFYEEGYAMYQLDDDDYKALLSFMVLSFLPHQAGHGRQATNKKISRGPMVFGNLIQNWQLVSQRLSNELGFSPVSTVHYYPQQGTDGDVPKKDDIWFESIQKYRKQKQWGRYWLISDVVLKDEFGLRLHWGLILEIEQGKKDDKNEPIKCGICAFITKGGKQFPGGKIDWLPKGILTPSLYQPEKFMNLLRDHIKGALEPEPAIANELKLKQLVSDYPELEALLK
jgi:hypothetical protein